MVVGVLMLGMSDATRASARACQGINTRLRVCAYACVCAIACATPKIQPRISTIERKRIFWPCRLSCGQDCVGWLIAVRSWWHFGNLLILTTNQTRNATPNQDNPPPVALRAWWCFGRLCWRWCRVWFLGYCLQATRVDQS